MKNVVFKPMTFLIFISIFYSILKFNIIMMLPILTVVIPYRYLRYNDIKKDKIVFRNLLIFNVVVFLGSCIITNKVSIEILEIICNLLFVTIYFFIESYIISKEEKLYKNPEKLYEKITHEIDSLEQLKQKVENDENIIYKSNKKSEESNEKINKLKEDMIQDLDKKIEELKIEANKLKEKLEKKDENLSK